MVIPEYRQHAKQTKPRSIQPNCYFPGVRQAAKIISVLEGVFRIHGFPGPGPFFAKFFRNFFQKKQKEKQKREKTKTISRNSLDLGLPLDLQDLSLSANFSKILQILQILQKFSENSQKIQKI